MISSSIRNKRIAIVGGGPGGLMLARLLQMNGAKVRVYERDRGEFVRPQGATLNINGDSGLKAFERAGLMAEFVKAYRPGAEGLVLVDSAARVRVREPAPAHVPGTALGESDRPEIDRGPLRDLLLGSLKSGTVVWDWQFVSLERKADGVHLVFKDGSAAVADLVVACDGASSRARPYVTPLKPVYSGITVVEGVVSDLRAQLPWMHELIDGGKVCALGDGRSLFVILKGDGSAAFYTGHRAPETWAREGGVDFGDRAAVLTWFKREFASWDPRWYNLFMQTSLPVTPRPQYCAPLDQTWEALADLTLLGDAAHVMPPYAGEGVNMALVDALELAKELLDPAHGEAQVAIAAYERRMRPRAAEYARETMKNTEIFHSPQALEHFASFFGGSGPR